MSSQSLLILKITLWIYHTKQKFKDFKSLNPQFSFSSQLPFVKHWPIFGSSGSGQFHYFSICCASAALWEFWNLEISHQAMAEGCFVGVFLVLFFSCYMYNKLTFKFTRQCLCLISTQLIHL